MERALAAVQACNDSLAEAPMQLLNLPAEELSAYRACLDDRPRSKQHFYLCTRRTTRCPCAALPRAALVDCRRLRFHSKAASCLAGLTCAYLASVVCVSSLACVT